MHAMTHKETRSNKDASRDAIEFLLTPSGRRYLVDQFWQRETFIVYVSVRTECFDLCLESVNVRMAYTENRDQILSINFLLSQKPIYN